ncbi:MAG: endolytic transglycosylase MltG [Bacteroidetes bacterium]|nr:endolytic transglycosylase MltG [Bacteroidota bacterium]MBX7044636.1 endolytic transglycosylase MltG [Ignavibacteria bacterium]
MLNTLLQNSFILDIVRKFSAGNPKKVFTKYLIILSAFNIFLCGFIVQQSLYSKYKWKDGKDKEFDVRPGENFSEIVKELKEKDIIPSAVILKIAGKITGKDDKIISRRYIFKSGMTTLDILNIMTDPSLFQSVKFTVNEGLTVKQIGKFAEKYLGLSKEKFIEEAQNDSLIKLLGLKDSITSLEGFLYPDTYDVPLEITEKGLVKILFNEFRKRVFNNPEIMDSIAAKKMNFYDVMKMASIIEGETRKEDEKSRIAGVYYNRIRKNMKLEADPTVQYALPDGPKKRLTYDDLHIKSPYNTYIIKGLPPGPINNPSVSSIKAAINPESHNYIFFVATGEGGHTFTENYADHLKAVDVYRKKMNQGK